MAEERVTGSAVARLRGLPFQATDDDIKEFFTGFNVVHIHVCRRNGRATGEAYVQFSNETEAANALKARNCKHMGQRYIEIFEALESDLNSKKVLGPDLKLKGYVVRMRGLPFSATAADVLKFFEEVEVMKGEDGVVFTCNPDGRPTGEAYIELPTEEAQQQAMAKHKEKMGPRYIELFHSSKGDMLQAIQQNGYYLGQAERRKPSHAQIPSTGPAATIDGSTLKLRGLPYSAGIDEITDFFQGFGIDSKDVQLLTKPDRTGNVTGTGVAFVQFENPQEADRAREQRHRSMMGSRYIECLPYAAPNKASAEPGSGHSSQRTSFEDPQTPPQNQQKPQPHVMAAHDFSAAQQHQLLMQQHFMMQQHMLQQHQQALRGFEPQNPWGGIGAGMVQTQQGTAHISPAAWFKGFGSPAMALPAGQVNALNQNNFQPNQQGAFGYAVRTGGLGGLGNNMPNLSPGNAANATGGAVGAPPQNHEAAAFMAHANMAQLAAHNGHGGEHAHGQPLMNGAASAGAIGVQMGLEQGQAAALG